MGMRQKNGVLMILPESTNTSHGPAMQKMLAAFPQAKEKSNGWWGHPNNPRFDFRENENGSISIHSWTGRSRDEILAMGGLQNADIHPKGYKSVKVRDSLGIIDLSHAKLIPWEFLTNLGLQDGYRYQGRNYVKIPYYHADGSQHTKVKVRKAISGEYKQCWDDGTPGEIIPYGLNKLDPARDYLLIGEGESDAWACWLHGIPYLGVPGSDFQKCLKHVDIALLPSKVYLLLESDQMQRLLSNGTGFYKNIHNALRTAGYQGEIFCIDFKKATGRKDPSDLHIAEWTESQAKNFKAIMERSMSQAIPANDIQSEIPALAIQNERVLKALIERRLQELYALAPEIAEMGDIEQSHIKLAAHDIWKKDFPAREFESLLRVAKIENERKRMGDPSPISAYDLMRKQFDPIEYAVPDILPMGLIILGGKQKIGKSWLDLNMGLAVASGGIALGKYPVKQGDVLYLALEDTERRLQDRIGQLLGPGNAAPESLHIETKWPRMDAKGIAFLEKWLTGHPDTRMVIIDPWVKVKPRVRNRNGETGYDADYEALAGIKDLADRYRVCVLVQFHLRKQNADDPFDEVNATTGATACADGFVSVKRVRGESEATLYASGRDYKEEVNIALSFNDGMWKVLGDGKAAAYYTLSSERKATIDLLCGSTFPSGETKPMTPKDIAVLLGEEDTNRIRRLLFKMKDDGQIEWADSDGSKEGGYISLIPSPKVQTENKNANCGNSGNAGNSGNSGNAGNGHQFSTSGEGDHTQSVTENDDRYRPLPEAGNGPQDAPQEGGGRLEGGGVTAVTAVTEFHKNGDLDKRDGIVIPFPDTASQNGHTHAKTSLLATFWEIGRKRGYPEIPDMGLRSGKMGWNSFSLTHRLRISEVITRLGGSQ